MLQYSARTLSSRVSLRGNSLCPVDDAADDGLTRFAFSVEQVFHREGGHANWSQIDVGESEPRKIV